MANYTFEIVHDQKDLIKYYTFIEKIPYIDITPETMLGRCLTKQYCCFVFLEDEEPVGVLIGNVMHPTMHVVGIYLKGKLKYFREAWFAKLRELEFKVVTSGSMLPEKAYEKVTTFDKWYTVYRKEL